MSVVCSADREDLCPGRTLRGLPLPDTPRARTECQLSARQDCRGTKDTTVGTSTNFSAFCGSLRNFREEREGYEVLGTAVTCSGTTGASCQGSSARPTGPSSAARVHQETAPGEQRRAAPRCAAAPTPAAEAPRESRAAREEEQTPRRVVHLTFLLPGPCRALALCAVVLTLGKGHAT